MENQETLEKTVVYFSIQNGGDGSAYPSWYLTLEEAETNQDEMDEGWGESCTGSVETFVGSDIYFDGLNNRKDKEVRKVLEAFIQEGTFSFFNNKITIFEKCDEEKKENINKTMLEKFKEIKITFKY